MILQALAAYYERQQTASSGGDRVAPAGFEYKEIPFVIELDHAGDFVSLADTRGRDGNIKTAQRFLVPQAEKRTVQVKANLLWDTAEYVLGIPDQKKLDERQKKGKADDYLSRVKDMHRAFIARLDELPESTQEDAGVQAVRTFFRGDRRDDRLGAIQALPAWEDIAKTNPFMGFRLHGDLDLVCQRPDVVAALRQSPAQPEEAGAVCLLSGKPGLIERLHPPIKGVWGAQTSGANIVSFNLGAFRSYGKLQGANAPISKAAASAYTSALNHLLRKESSQRVQVGDTSTVFWAEQPNALETALPDIFGEPPKDDPDQGTRAIAELYRAVSSGHFALGTGEDRFHVLGLAPNAARISIRFWETAPAIELAQRIRQHFEDLRIARGPNDPEYLSLFRLLVSCAQQGKADNIPPHLGGDVMRAILTARPYPTTLLHAAVQRCRAEQRVTYPRAAAIKAWLCRDQRRAGADSFNPATEPTPMLDVANPSPAYRLGRLFATLERIQEEASPGINATIRDRFYGAASGTPVSVFPTLMRLKNHHIGKLTKGRAVNMERLIAEILEGLADFPSQMAMPDQGRFAIGYYHQRQAFFTKRTPKTGTTDPNIDDPHIDHKETDS
ncbi:type I-C CRISPR-associated protein Cas8c/Csd1 [Thiorhodovibrio frisius]|uniref:CRISPR-associated protein Cas8c/Csd1, subtype I-C/DVULG n=1 Tax=Thiorhodovibrio frisius TaxID=631362 RepID=H8Z3W1_9GAMM|nr:type I-C CRISPR-associated protein Cas8c/Csd1 [Thiorhodovibrio frisius]EIC21113.1 CRISPR-associated protein Cas8c/Csd1, subtype I-C/DVULG [Thiorhodovibrio frisius]WPL22173.1 CRISPR-associated protein Cas8c/Csd1, subtype I-C/DVULG [Thiorhodovibrio frisius]